jgi:hypothetical protein
MAAICIQYAGAQNEVKYEKLYYKDVEQDYQDYSIKIDNAVSTAGVTKFKIKITNKGNDYILFKPSECVLKIQGKEEKITDKSIIIAPGSSDFKTLDVKGTGFNRVTSYELQLGGIYFISTEGKVVTVPNFNLPPSENEMKSGPVTLNMTSLEKTTGKTSVKFECMYTGSKVLIVDPGKIAVKMPDGYEYVNENKAGLLGSDGPYLLFKGDSEKLSLKWERMQGGKAMDMQKVKMEILWRKAFIESEPVKQKGQIVSLEIDTVTSEAKGK